MSDTGTTPIQTDLSDKGEYAPAGEAQGVDATFSADQVAGAFDVAKDRVLRAIDGEFGMGPDGQVDSRQAQHLAEVIIGDQPLDKQMAALMQLGAYTPRSDEVYGRGEAAPSEESDKLERQGDEMLPL